VLSQLVARRGLQLEPVATDALTHLLATSAEAARAMIDLTAAVMGVHSLGPLSFKTQVTVPDAEGKPDLIGADASGVRLVGGAKFDASLTKHQSTTAYLDRLSKGQPGVLFFIAPEDRLGVLWPQLLAGPACRGCDRAGTPFGSGPGRVACRGSGGRARSRGRQLGPAAGHASSRG
jgi:hypothetical protein